MPDVKTVRNLLREFMKQKTKIAIVLDEYGGTAGVVTTTDIYEELVGDMEDEEDEPAGQAEIVKIDEKTSEVDARVRVDEFNEEFDVHLPDGEGYDTVGGLILSKLGRIPKVGDTLEIDGVQITVLAGDERRISRVRVWVEGQSGVGGG